MYINNKFKLPDILFLHIEGLRVKKWRKIAYLSRIGIPIIYINCRHSHHSVYGHVLRKSTWCRPNANRDARKRPGGRANCELTIDNLDRVRPLRHVSHAYIDLAQCSIAAFYLNTQCSHQTVHKSVFAHCSEVGEHWLRKKRVNTIAEIIHEQHSVRPWQPFCTLLSL